MESGVQVKRCICTMCGAQCGILAYVRDGKIVKLRGNPDNPISRGHTCKRIASAIKWLYHPNQLMYPLKRVGERGEGKWTSITYDEALDEIAAKLKELREKYGAHVLATAEGTLRYAEFWMRARFMNLFGSPNNFHPGVICGLNREVMGNSIAGFRVCPKLGNLQDTRCVVIQSGNPRGWNPRMAEQLRRIKELEPGRLRVIVIDPRDTGIATEKTDMHLEIRPGTDAALMLAWLRIIINEELYDKNFVEKYTFGFDKLVERVQEYTTEKVAEITGIPADQITESARIFATTKPAFLLGGVGTDQIAYNATRVEQACACLMTITGNVDIPGGRYVPAFPGVTVNGKRPIRDCEMELTDKLPKEQRAKLVGGEQFRLTGFRGHELWGEPYAKTYGVPAPSLHVISANEPLLYRGIVNNDPNHIRAILSWASNIMVRTANTKMVYEALRSPNLELNVVLEFTMTPTAQLADYVLPAASCFERPYWTTWEDFSDACCFGEAAIEPLGERRDDYHFWRGLGIRLGQEKYWPWQTHEEVIEYRAKPIGLTFEELVKASGLRPPAEFKKYEKRGFATNTGKIELYSTVLDKLGYDPLPYYSEPPESYAKTPDVAEDFPLILITGGRSNPQYHSEYHQMSAGMRERHVDPIVDINTETARQQGINDGDWIYIETKRGKIRQKAHVTDGILPNIINCEASWWYPEMQGEEPGLHGLWESSANVLTWDEPDICDEMVGGWACRALLCRVSKA